MCTYYKKGITSSHYTLGNNQQATVTCNKFHGFYAFFQRHSHAPFLCSLQLVANIALYISFSFLLIIVLTFLTFLSCSIFSSLHYFFFTILTFLTIFSTFLVFRLQ